MTSFRYAGLINLLFLCSLAQSLNASSLPQTISYQGYLKDGTGKPVTSPTNLTFRLYSSTSGAGPIWSESRSVTPANGVYSVELGNVMPFGTLTFDRQYFLGVRAGTDPELRPLQPLTSVPYALRASVAETIPDLAGLQTSIAQLQTTVAQQQTTITQLQTTTTQQQGQIENLLAQVGYLNSPPSPFAGYDQWAAPGTPVVLYGKGNDPDGNQPLSYAWSIVSRPKFSTALLTAPNAATTAFFPDKVGAYQFRLTVSDGFASATSTVALTAASGMMGRAQLIETNEGDADYPQVAMGGDGNAMAVWAQWDGASYHIWANRYTVSDGWDIPQLVETDNAADAWLPKVAMDPGGNAVAVWEQFDGTRINIWANRYVAGTGWGIPQLIETDNAGSADSLQVAMDAGGNAVAVWEQSDGTRYNIWANRYVAGTGWGTALRIETDNAGDAFAPQVAVDAAGNAVAVWQQSDGTRINIWANRFVAGTGWGTAQLIETNNAGSAQYPRVALNSAGNAVAVWKQSDGTRTNIWSNQYVIGTGWGTAQLIETDITGNADSAHVAMDGNGNAVAVWWQFDGTRTNIWANRYVAGTGWETAQLIQTDNVVDAYYPHVAVDVVGNAVAVWYQFDGTRRNIWANRYVAGSGWGTAQLIETDNVGDSWYPQVAMDAGGNAVAVWYQSDGNGTNIWASLVSAGMWGSAQLVETDNAGHAQYPKLAMDPGGNAVAVWQQSDGTRYNIWSNRYVAGSGWGIAQLIETDNAGDAEFPQVAMDSGGNAVALWYQSDGTRDNIWANRYVAGSGWGTAQLIETDNAGGALYPEVALNAGGNAVAVWQQSDGTRYNIWANRYVAGSGWGTAQLIETDNAGDAWYPRVAIDAVGNAVVVWFQHDGTRYNIWANRYVAGTGWETARLIETDNAGDAKFPRVAIDSGGNAVAVWEQSDGTRTNIWANRYVAGKAWGIAQLIETDNTWDAAGPEVALDAVGNAVAVWYQSVGTGWNIWSNRYVVGSGWGTAQFIGTDTAVGAANPRLAMDAVGNAVAVWGQWDGMRNNIWSKRYVAGIGWGTAQLIEPNNVSSTEYQQVAVDAVGNAMAVWRQLDGSRYNIWANLLR